MLINNLDKTVRLSEKCYLPTYWFLSIQFDTPTYSPFFIFIFFPLHYELIQLIKLIYNIFLCCLAQSYVYTYIVPNVAQIMYQLLMLLGRWYDCSKVKIRMVVKVQLLAMLACIVDHNRFNRWRNLWLDFARP